MRRAWLPAVCAVLQVIAVSTGDTRTPAFAAGAAFLCLGLAAGLSLAWRDRLPVTVLISCAVGYVLQALLLAPPVPAALALMSYELVRRAPPGNDSGARPTRSNLGLLVGSAVLGAMSVAVTGHPALVAPYGLVLVTASAGGLLVASHDTREQSRRRELLAEQRLRIARDLHDAVGHSAGAIGVQAGAARLALAAGSPGDAASAVRDIEIASRDLLREVRWLVGLLREDAELPGLDEIGDLLGTARRSGLDLHVVTSGDGSDVPPEVGHAAYRILQEAITNVLRHGAEPRAATVTLEVSDAVLVRVCNPAASEGSAAPGHGLVGMGERAAEVGGAVRTGRDESGAWVVEARLPMRVP